MTLDDILHQFELVTLRQTDITRPFVYYRKHGTFYCSGGQHTIVMASFLAIDHQLIDVHDIDAHLNIPYLYEAAEHWLITTPGTCFRSSVSGQSGSLYAGKRGNLSAIERTIFTPITYLLNDEE